MRSRWMLAASLLLLLALPGALHAADLPGCSPAPALAPAAALATPANAPASDLASTTPVLPAWAADPATPAVTPALPGIAGTPLPIVRSCSGCTFQLCQRLHSCLGCC